MTSPDFGARLRQLERLIEAVQALRDRAIGLERSFEDAVRQVRPEHRASVLNLLHYVALRQHDVRALQKQLGALGLSSLGRSEAHVLAALQSVLDALHQLAGTPSTVSCVPAPVDFRSGPALLADHAQKLLGPRPEQRGVRIMVTMPSEAASDPRLVRDLVAAGMDVMRINCAHDDPTAWRAMVAHLRSAERKLGKSCRVLADLSGPKLRTGPLAPAPGVVKLRPKRDRRGRVLAPARVCLVAPNQAAGFAAGELPAVAVEAPDFAQRARPGDRVRLRDTRGRTRMLDVVEVRGSALLAETSRTVYLESGSELRLERAGRRIETTRVGALPPFVPKLRLRQGDILLLTRGSEPGLPEQRDAEGRLVAPARIPCSPLEVFEDARPGHRIWFDDGKLGGVIESIDAAGLRVRITAAASAGTKLAADKGINLPDTRLSVPALTEKDLRDLAVIGSLADMVGLSFVRSPADVELLEKRRHEAGADHLGLVLKIETAQGFEQLPHLLMAGLRLPSVGVMVARGDLAVEVGFERLAEVQEEILWLCEAAHVPVIWATQVLENLTKKGAPSRAEVTDAAMSGRAECVMLNKGAHVVRATEFLSGVLERMANHQSKKSSMLRKLAVSRML
jgi:pyruvate kinase